MIQDAFAHSQLAFGYNVSNSSLLVYSNITWSGPVGVYPPSCAHAVWKTRGRRTNRSLELLEGGFRTGHDDGRLDLPQLR